MNEDINYYHTFNKCHAVVLLSSYLKPGSKKTYLIKELHNLLIDTLSNQLSFYRLDITGNDENK